MNRKIFLGFAVLILSFAFGICGCGNKLSKDTTVRVAGLKGPTSLGLLALLEKNEKGEAKGNYTFQMMTGADEILPLMIKEELDIALIPANVAALLYQKSESGICVIDINTLGVLYLVSGDLGIAGMADLSGKTIYLTGKGTTPDYVIRYLLEANGVRDVTLEYRSEPTEVAALLAENPSEIGLLPQPFVTAACIQNESLFVVMDLTEQWDLLQGDEGSRLVTGVTVVRKAFLEEHPQAVESFVKEHEESVKTVLSDIDHSSVLAVESGIVAKEPIAKMAIPGCNIVCITGEEMKTSLSGYLRVLYEQDPSSVGGSLPGEDFYH